MTEVYCDRHGAVGTVAAGNEPEPLPELTGNEDVETEDVRRIEGDRTSAAMICVREGIIPASALNVEARKHPKIYWHSAASHDLHLNVATERVVAFCALMSRYSRVQSRESAACHV
ncbi:MAG: hypothetical protein GJU76_01735 [Gallionella sp.]|jgi:hypothetical protein|nr:hypothetical protein [Gallionella sp.]